MSLRAHTAIALSLAALGCGGSGATGPAPIATISVDLAQSSIVIGQTTTATATPRDASGNVLTGRTVSWSSSNTTVATVSTTGVIFAASAGTAGITAQSEGQSGTATLTVVVPPVASVTVTLASPTIGVGATTQATATIRDAGGAVLTGRAVAWSSDNSFVATVSNAGVVSGVGAGSANITATSEGQSGSATVTVTSVAVASVTVSLASSTIGIGRTTQATATTKDASGNVLVGRSVTWSSDNTSATVSTTGVVTGVATGTANITAMSEGRSGSAGITVAASLGFGSSAEKIRILDVGSAFTPTLTGPSSSTTTFVSRATSVATVDAQGRITAVGEGQVWVAATAPGWIGDSVYVIVPRTSTGPVLRSDLTTFNVSPGTTNFVINIILDTRSTPIGGAELSVGFTTSPTIFTGGTYAATGSPTPEVSNPQAALLRVSLASGSPLSGQLAILRLTFNVTSSNAAGFLTLTLISIVSPTGTDLLPVSTSTRIPIIVQ